MTNQRSQQGRAATIVVIALALFAVILISAAAVIGVSFYAFQKEEGNSDTSGGGETITDRIGRINRSLRGSTTDAEQITSVVFEVWNHAGPLYPGPNDPPGYVSTSTTEFRRDLAAYRQTKKDYDAVLTDEVTRSTAQLTPEQFARLAQVCAENDILNEPDSTQTRSEGGARLILDYAGQKKTIVTSNMGQNTAEAAKVLQAIATLERSLRWTPEPAK